MINLSKEQIQQIIKCRQSAEYFVDNFVWIQNPAGRQTIPLKCGKDDSEPFFYQRRLLRDLGKGKSVLILKHRRAGASWSGCSFAAQQVNFVPGVNILFISKTERHAVGLLEKVKFILNNLAYKIDETNHKNNPSASFLRNKIIIDNNTTLAIGWENADGKIVNMSKITSLTSNPDSSIGEGASFVLIDEFPALNNSDDLWTAVRPTIEGGGFFMGCGTPRRIAKSPTFHRLIQNYERGDNIDSNGNRTYELYKVTWEQTGKTKEEILRISKDMTSEQFQQEYELKFLEDDTRVFSETHLRLCYKPVEYYPDIAREIDNYRANFSHENCYFIGVDTAEGKSGKTAERDYHSVSVLTRSGIQCYAYHDNKMSLTDWAGAKGNVGFVSKIHALFPGNCAVEDNGVGNAVIINYEVPKDGISQVKPFNTNAKSKKRLINQLVLAVEQHLIVITDKFTFECMANYVKNELGGTEASPGNYDDPVISLAIAWNELLKQGGMEFDFGNDAASLNLQPISFNDAMTNVGFGVMVDVELNNRTNRGMFMKDLPDYTKDLRLDGLTPLSTEDFYDR